MPLFTIKLATTADIPTIVAIHNATWEPTYREILSQEQIDFMSKKFYSPQALTNSIRKDKHQFILLFVNELPSGFASVSEGETGYFKLNKIYILPSCQGTGAGKFLITEVESYVKQKGGMRISLNVNRYNKARYFYEKMTYRIMLPLSRIS